MGRKVESARLCFGLAKFGRNARCSEQKTYKDIEDLSELSTLKGLFYWGLKRKERKMILKDSKKDAGYESAAMREAIVEMSLTHKRPKVLRVLKKENHFESVNYKTGCFRFFPFSWFAFCQRQKMCKPKYLLTKA